MPINYAYLALFFFNDPATTEIYTLSLHDALPISDGLHVRAGVRLGQAEAAARLAAGEAREETEALRLGAVVDRKSTRLNSSHTVISYAVFCLKKKKKEKKEEPSKNKNRNYRELKQ